MLEGEGEEEEEKEETLSGLYKPHNSSLCIIHPGTW